MSLNRESTGNETRQQRIARAARLQSRLSPDNNSRNARETTGPLNLNPETMTPMQLTALLNETFSDGTRPHVVSRAKVNERSVFEEELEKEVESFLSRSAKGWKNKLLDGSKEEYTILVKDMAAAAAGGQEYTLPPSFPLSRQRFATDTLGRKSPDGELRQSAPWTAGRWDKQIREYKLIEKAAVAARRRLTDAYGPGSLATSSSAPESRQATTPEAAPGGDASAASPTGIEPATNSPTAPDALPGQPVAPRDGGQQPSVTDLLQAIKEKGNFGNITIIGDVGSKNANGYSGAQPQAPANAPAAHGHAEAVPGHGAHGHEAAHAPGHGHEATPQGNEALRQRYWEINRQEDEAFAELKAHIDSPDRKEKLAKLEQLRIQRKAVFDQFAVPFGGREAALQMARQEIAAEAAERGQNAPTAGEAGAALDAIKAGKTKEWSEFIGRKYGEDSARVRRWMWAPVRWGWKATSGILTGLTGFGGKYALASTFAPWFASAAGTSTTTLFGALSAPVAIAGAAPFVGAATAAAVGVIAWQLVRNRMSFFTSRDRMTDIGYEAKKARNFAGKNIITSPGEAAQYVLHRTPKWRRWQTVVPGLMGAVLGYGIGNNITQAYTLGWDEYRKSVAAKSAAQYENAKKLSEDLNGGLKSLWNSFDISAIKKWFTGGEKVAPGVSAPDCSAAIGDMRKPLDVQIADLKIANSSLAEMATGAGASEEQLAEAQKKIVELERQLAEAQAGGGKVEAPVAAEPPSRPKAPPPEAVPSRPRVGIDAVLPDRSVLEATLHMNSGKTGMWGASEEFWKKTGLSGPKLRWFTDLIEDYTQDGSAPPDYRQSSYFRKGLLEKITNGAASTQTRIPLGTPLHLEHLFGDPAIRDSILQRVSQSPYSQLSLAEKDKVMESIKQLFEGSRQLLNIRGM